MADRLNSVQGSRRRRADLAIDRLEDLVQHGYVLSTEDVLRLMELLTTVTLDSKHMTPEQRAWLLELGKQP